LVTKLRLALADRVALCLLVAQLSNGLVLFRTGLFDLVVGPGPALRRILDGLFQTLL